MNVDDTSADPAAERFAAAVDGGVAGAADPELARELQIVDLLAAQAPAFDPEPEARARARLRLLAALDGRTSDDGPSRAS